MAPRQMTAHEQHSDKIRIAKLVQARHARGRVIRMPVMAITYSDGISFHNSNRATLGRIKWIASILRPRGKTSRVRRVMVNGSTRSAKAA